MKTMRGIALLLMGMISFSGYRGDKIDLVQAESSARVESFTFVSNGEAREGKIHLPATYETNKNLPAIYLIDFTEQHFKNATDEFEKVIDGIRLIDGFDALVVSLKGIPDIDAEPGSFRDHYEIYKSLASFVDGKYTNNTTRTFIGKGSESGVVLMALFSEDEENSVFDYFIATDPSGLYAAAIIELLEDDPLTRKKSNKKLHFSYSTSNDRARCNKIIELIRGARYSWLQFESIEYTNSVYENTYPVSYPAGIRFVFSK